MDDSAPTSAGSTSRLGAIVGRLACYVVPITLALALLVPVRNQPIRCLILTSAAVTIVAWLIRLRRRPLLAAGIGTLCLAAAGPFLLPGRKPDVARLRQACARALESYEGTRYWWGGETRIGIDCSGLMRAALMDACLSEGIRTWNGALMRQALSLWWHDESAMALGAGDGGWTAPVCVLQDLNDPASAHGIEPGDMAVVGGGVHVIANLGDREWIHAEPGAERVLRTETPTKNPWFVGRSVIVRWTVLRNETGDKPGVEGSSRDGH